MSRSHPLSIGSIGSIGLCPLINGQSTPRDLYSMSSYSIDYDASTNTNFSDATLKPSTSYVFDNDFYSHTSQSAVSKLPSKVTRFSNIVKAYPPTDRKQQQQQQIHFDSNNQDKNSQKNTDNFSSYESAILKSSRPIKVNSNDKIQINGHRGILLNKSELKNWKGAVPLEFYPINVDPNPQLIIKKDTQKIDYTQNIRIKYLKPPTPPAPGELIIRQEPNKITAPAPPLIIRQQPPKPVNPPPLVIREAPPDPPPYIPSKVIRVSGKVLPPPPRKVIIERLPPVPPKPQAIIIERWLPYNENVKRRVIFQKKPDPIHVKPRNVIVEWEPPEVCIKKDYEHYGVVKADPCEYIQKYGNTLKNAKDLPKFAQECSPPKGLVLANTCNNSKRKVVYELIGDVDALKLINLDREGLSEYKSLLKSQSKINCQSNTNSSSSSFNKNSNSIPISNSSSSRHLCSSKSKTCLTYRQC